MTDTRLKTAHGRSSNTKKGNGTLRHDIWENVESSDSDASEEKDETEERLEKLVFGDDAGFYDSLKSFQQEKSLVQPVDTVSEDNSSSSPGPDLGEVDDTEVAFNVPSSSVCLLIRCCLSCFSWIQAHQIHLRRKRPPSLS